ncbi:cytochrome c oxidase accessory protein CcoG [Henriciella marina]|uniref:cytochrome c oxidase accessory protein CcoG n=1 Tax=Henriciella marina TaxID=453851 RepID=UPI0003759E42|nr:cytochrome c oxidase accessory protein CcoG [Henriciella marina]
MPQINLIPSRSPPPVPPPQDLYAKRKQIYPKLAHGKFRTVKWVAMGVLLGVYYLIPWLRWERGAGVPDQAVLADFAGERFFFFGIEIWPQEAYYLAGLMILAAIGLFLVTSLFGRVWCGYACPQTVWTDLYIWVERAFEGDRAKRIRLDKAPWGLNKAARKIGKHIVWVLIAFVTGGAFILYFHDARLIAQTFFIGEAPLSAYWFAGLLTFTTYALAGTMREQVCTYLCPWPRIQAALTDEDALNVTYRYDRGEPRGPHRKGESWQGRGDCIDCKQCVQVCPVGIDIRDGPQLECIHCALCIDACDGIMKTVGRPTGLIAYDTDTAVAARAVGMKPKYRLVRARTVLYFVLMTAIASLMAFGLLNRGTIEVNVLKDRSPPYVRLSSGLIQNGYTLKLVNKAGETREMEISIADDEGFTLKVVGIETVAGEPILLPVASNGVDRYRLLVTTPEQASDGRQHFQLVLTDVETGEIHTNRTSFMAPGE